MRSRRPHSLLRWSLVLCFLVPALCVLSINLWVAQPALPPEPATGETIAYFAYGSNMNDRYLTRVRGVTRTSSEIATLPGYAVRFNLGGFDELEPSFANLSPEPDAVAYGIMHRLPSGEFEKISGSEGGGYNVRDVTVFLRDGSAVFAKTLISKPSLDQPAIPSRRYLSYLHEAAEIYDFPPEVINAYDPQKGAYVPVISEAFGAAILTVVWVNARL